MRTRSGAVRKRLKAGGGIMKQMAHEARDIALIPSGIAVCAMSTYAVGYMLSPECAKAMAAVVTIAMCGIWIPIAMLNLVIKQI